jgi:signal peptidase II
MSELHSLRQTWQRTAVFFLITLAVVSADQLTKFWIRSNLAVGESLPESGFFQLTYVRNTGGVFGLFQGQSFLLTIFSIIGIVVILLLVLFMYRQFHILNTLPGKISMGLILGGTIGNLIDRISLGYVTDFIAVGTWPPFNIADSAVTVGAILMALLLVRQAQEW